MQNGQPWLERLSDWMVLFCYRCCCRVSSFISPRQIWGRQSKEEHPRKTILRKTNCLKVTHIVPSSWKSVQYTCPSSRALKNLYDSREYDRWLHGCMRPATALVNILVHPDGWPRIRYKIWEKLFLDENFVLPIFAMFVWIWRLSYRTWYIVWPPYT